MYLDKKITLENAQNVLTTRREKVNLAWLIKDFYM